MVLRTLKTCIPWLKRVRENSFHASEENEIVSFRSAAQTRTAEGGRPYADDVIYPKAFMRLVFASHSKPL
jgi:hypothetical protein